MKTTEIIVLGLAAAIAVGLSAGLAYGMMGRQSFQSGGYGGGVGTGYGYGMMGQGPYSGGMMGGYGYGMMGSGAAYGGMMGGYGIGQYSQYPENRTAGTFVAIVGYGFHPQTLTVTKGTTVTWVNMDFVPHTVTAGSEQAPTNLFDSHELGHMQSFSYTFNTAGTYSYYCDVHPDMVGTIVVTG